MCALVAVCGAEAGAGGAYGVSQLVYTEAPGFEGRLHSLSNGTGVLREALVGFVHGEKYGALMAVAVSAACAHSRAGVVLFAAGDVGLGDAPARLWPPAEHPSLVVLSMPAGTMHPWFDKIRAMLLAPVERALIFEADSIATRHVDRLFHALAREPSYPFPLIPQHAHLRWPTCEEVNGWGVTLIQVDPSDPRTRACGSAYPFPLEMRTTHYGHAHVMWGAAAKPFVASLLLACAAPGNGAAVASFGGRVDCGSDESALNTGLWMRKAPRAMCVFDPDDEHMDGWATAAPGTRAPWYSDSLGTQTVAWAFVHGEKDPAKAEALKQRVAAMPAGTPWIADRGTWLPMGTESKTLAPANSTDGAWRGADGCEL